MSISSANKEEEHDNTNKKSRAGKNVGQRLDNISTSPRDGWKKGFIQLKNAGKVEA